MSSRDAEAVRIEAFELIRNEIQLTRQLKATLNDERAALEKQDADAIEQVASAKSALVEKLHAIDSARTRLCLTHDVELGDEQMRHLIDWCDSKNTLQSAWDELLNLATDCRALNTTNGAIVRLRQQHFASSLAVLSGVQPNRETYTRGGETTASAEGRAIATA